MEAGCDLKLKELKEYIPFLESTIGKLETHAPGSEDTSRQFQLSKMRSLRDLLLSDKRFKMNDLLRCEGVLMNIYAQIRLGITLPDFISQPSPKVPPVKENFETARRKLIEFIKTQQNTFSKNERANLTEVASCESEEPIATRQSQFNNPNTMSATPLEEHSDWTSFKSNRVSVSSEPAPMPEKSLENSPRKPHKSGDNQTKKKKRDTRFQKNFYRKLRKLLGTLKETIVKEDVSENKKISNNKCHEFEAYELSHSENESRSTEDDQESEMKSKNKIKESKTIKKTSTFGTYNIVDPNELSVEVIPKREVPKEFPKTKEPENVIMQAPTNDIVNDSFISPEIEEMTVALPELEVFKYYEKEEGELSDQECEASVSEDTDQEFELKSENNRMETNNLLGAKDGQLTEADINDIITELKRQSPVIETIIGDVGKKFPVIIPTAPVEPSSLLTTTTDVRALPAMPSQHKFEVDRKSDNQVDNPGIANHRFSCYEYPTTFVHPFGRSNTYPQKPRCNRNYYEEDDQSKAQHSSNGSSHCKQRFRGNKPNTRHKRDAVHLGRSRQLGNEQSYKHRYGRWQAPSFGNTGSVMKRDGIYNKHINSRKQMVYDIHYAHRSSAYEVGSRCLRDRSKEGIPEQQTPNRSKSRDTSAFSPAVAKTVTVESKAEGRSFAIYTRDKDTFEKFNFNHLSSKSSFDSRKQRAASLGRILNKESSVGRIFNRGGSVGPPLIKETLDTQSFGQNVEYSDHQARLDSFKAMAMAQSDKLREKNIDRHCELQIETPKGNKHGISNTGLNYETPKIKCPPEEVPPKKCDEQKEKIYEKTKVSDGKNEIAPKETKSKKEEDEVENKSIKPVAPPTKRTKKTSGPKSTEDSTSKAKKNKIKSGAKQEFKSSLDSSPQTQRKYQRIQKFKEPTPPEEAEDSSPIRMRRSKRPIIYDSESDDNTNNTSDFNNIQTKDKNLAQPHTSSPSKESEFDDLRIADDIVSDTVENTYKVIPTSISENKKSERKIQTLIKLNERQSEASLHTQGNSEQLKATSMLLPDSTNVAQSVLFSDRSSFNDQSDKIIEAVDKSNNFKIDSYEIVSDGDKLTKDTAARVKHASIDDNKSINITPIVMKIKTIRESGEEKFMIVEKAGRENTKHIKRSSLSKDKKLKPQAGNSQLNKLVEQEDEVFSEHFLPTKTNESNIRSGTEEQSVAPSPIVVFDKINKVKEIADKPKELNLPKQAEMVEPPKLALDVRPDPKLKTDCQAKRAILVEPYDIDDSISEMTKDNKNDLSDSDAEQLASFPCFESLDLPNKLNRDVTKAKKSRKNGKSNETAHLTKESWSSASEFHISDASSFSIEVPDWNCFIDTSYCFFKGNKIYQCRLCGVLEENIVHHYKKQHPHYEIPISRMNPQTANEAIKESKTVNFEQISEVPVLKHICRFCFTEIVDIRETHGLEGLFGHVVSKHTGEYKQACTECTTAKKCTFMLDIPPPPHEKTGILFGYICGKCNYIQVSLENIRNHVILRHDDEETKVYKISLGTLTESRFDSLKSHIAKDKPRATVNYNNNKNQSSIECEVLPPLRPGDNNETMKIFEGSTESITETFNVECHTDAPAPLLEQTLAISEELPAENTPDRPITDAFLHSHFKIHYSETGTKEYLCCINGDYHFRTNLLISMKRHLKIKHAQQQWDGYCCLCKVIVMPSSSCPPCDRDFTKLLTHLLDTHMGNFPEIEKTPGETSLAGKIRQESPTQLITQAPPAAEGLQDDNPSSEETVRRQTSPTHAMPKVSLHAEKRDEYNASVQVALPADDTDTNPRDPQKRSAREPAPATAAKLKRMLSHQQNVAQDVPMELVALMDRDEIHCEVAEPESIDALFKRFGAFCEPNGSKYKCPLCQQATEDSKEAMQSHLYEELKYRKWSCSICCHKAYHQKELKHHAFIEHRQSLDPLELPADKEVESWVTQLLKHQELIIEASLDNLQKQISTEKDENITNEPSTSQSTANTVDANDAGLNVETLGKFGVPSEGTLACPKCGFKDNDELQMSVHLIGEIDKLRWRCSICRQFFQLNQEAQLHCERLHPGQAARADHTICDPDLRNEWIKRVLQTQREILENSNPTVPEAVLSELEEPPTREPDHSLLVPRHEETVPTPDDHFATRSDDSLVKRKKAKRSDSDDKRSGVIDELQPAPATPDDQCPICEFRSPYQKALRAHILTHYDLKLYNCAYCNFNNASRRLVHRHQDRMHPNRSYKAIQVAIPNGEPADINACKTACMRSDDSLVLREAAERDDSDEKIYYDVLQPTPSSPGKFRCPFCKFKSPYKSNVRVHILRHYDVQPYKCAYCKYGAHRLSVFRHQTVEHPGKKHKASLVAIPRGEPIFIHL